MEAGWIIRREPDGQRAGLLVVGLALFLSKYVAFPAFSMRFRFGFDGKNPMSNKNLVFDEVHNMLALPRRDASYASCVGIGHLMAPLSPAFCRL